MNTCINCGKSGKKICDTCLEKVKKNKLSFLFPLNKNEATTIIDACKPELVTVEAMGSTQLPKSNVGVVENKFIPRAALATEEPTSIVEVQDAAAEVAPVAKLITKEENLTSSIVQKSQSSTNETQPKPTSRADTRVFDDNADFERDDVIRRSNGKWGWWIVVGVIVGIIVASILLPWSIGQWIVGIFIGIIMFTGFWLAIANCSEDKYIYLIIVLSVLSLTNEGLMLWIESGYSTIALVIAIALAICSLTVMVFAYFEDRKSLVNSALMYMLFNIAIISLLCSIDQWIAGIFMAFIVFIVILLLALDVCDDDDFKVLNIMLFYLSVTNIGYMLLIKSGYSTIGFVIAIALAISSLTVMWRAYYEEESKQGHWALFFMLINIASIFMWFM